MSTVRADPLPRRVGAWSRRLVARMLVRRALDLEVVGLEHVPEHGSVILVARHVHHLYDAAAILASMQREVHVLVAVDAGGLANRLFRSFFKRRC